MHSYEMQTWPIVIIDRTNLFRFYLLVAAVRCSFTRLRFAPRPSQSPPFSIVKLCARAHTQKAYEIVKWQLKEHSIDIFVPLPFRFDLVYASPLGEKWVYGNPGCIQCLFHSRMCVSAKFNDIISLRSLTLYLNLDRFAAVVVAASLLHFIRRQFHLVLMRWMRV